MEGALTGIRVLDLTRVLAGPVCTMMLADLGAEVIKIKILGKGDDSRAFIPFQNGESAYFMNLNRNKKGITRDWAKQYGVKKYFEFAGPCHQVMAETGNVRPGSVVLGTDSHTCMGGALGAFATGIGSTEMLGVLVTGQTWLKVPETIRVLWQGSLPAGVMAKDISLKTIGMIGHAGATYKAVEYAGETIHTLSMDERMAITNMAVEMGTKVGLMPVDETTKAYLAARGITDYPVDARTRTPYSARSTALTPPRWPRRSPVRMASTR